MNFSVHVRTLAGLEKVLAEELGQLGAAKIQLKSRLVVCEGDLRFLYRANLWCRTAIRVLRPLSSFKAEHEKALYNGIRAIDWTRWMNEMGTLSVDAQVHSSFTTHSLFLAQLVKDAVVDQFRDRFGKRPSVDKTKPDLRIAVNLFQGNAQVFVDSSGESLHRRGYRLEAGEAPLRETLAAGIIKLTGWDGSKPLVDPMCGSGTFLIEAGMMAKNIAPGILGRDFGFQKWSDYDRVLFESLVAEAEASIRKESVEIVGVELDPKVVTTARKNMTRAGVQDTVRIERGDFFNWDRVPETPGTLIMNPPYDERLPVDNLVEFYEGIGKKLRQSFKGWRAFVFSGNSDALECLGMIPSHRTNLDNGSIECGLLGFDLPLRGSPLMAPGVAIDPKWQGRADMFANRLKKNLKRHKQQAHGIKAAYWKVYDWDIPELPFVVEAEGELVKVREIPRNREHGLREHSQYLQLILGTVARTLKVTPEKVSLLKAR